MRVKTCSSCNQEKDLEEFHKDRNRPDGRRSACKVCRSERNARPEQIQLPPEPPPPSDPEELRKEARARAIRDTIENHMPEFTRRYERHLDQLGLSARWHSVN